MGTSNLQQVTGGDSMTIQLAWQFVIQTPAPSEVPAQVDIMMESLLSRENATLSDTSISLDMETNTLEVTFALSGLDLDEALLFGLETVRTAILASGGSTADTPDSTTSAGTTYRHKQLIAA